MLRRRSRLIRLLLFLGLLLGGCAAPGTVVDPARYEGPVRVACLGGSTTFGYGVRWRARDSDRDAYPAQLGRLLGSAWEVRNCGYVAATVSKKGDFPYVSSAAYAQALAFKPDVAIIMLGTNDSKPQNWRYADEFEADFRCLVGDLRRVNPHVRTYLCLLAPTVQAQWGIDDHIIAEQINPRLRRLARDLGLPLVDMYTPFLNRPELMADSVHPNRQGACLMAGVLYATLTGRAAPAFPAPATAARPVNLRPTTTPASAAP
jgi:lysophospholipase L1-like esterase